MNFTRFVYRIPRNPRKIIWFNYRSK
jgi:hypothetical protein